MSPLDAAKGAEITELLGKYACLHVHAVVARGVLGVPPNVPVLDGVVCLAWGLNLTGPISDLSVRGGALSGTLSFNGRGRLVTIPWRAIVGVRDGVTGRTLAVYPQAYVEPQGRAPEATHADPAPSPNTPATHADAEANVIRVDFRARRRA